MKATGEKWAANSKWMDGTVIPLRLPKTVLLSNFREMSGDICMYLIERMGERILKNHTNITKSLWKT